MPREGDSLPQASRSMADITRLFMTGARPAPVRTPPGAARPAADVPHISNDIQSQTQPLPVEKNATINLTVFIGNWSQAVVAAATMAVKEPIGVVGICGGHARIARVGPSANDAASAQPSAAPVEMQLARLLFMAKKSVSGWMVVVNPKERKEIDQLVPVTDRWLVAGGTDNDGLIESYRTLKALFDASRAQESNPAITLAFDTGDLVEAQRAFVRLSHVARSFLSQQLKFLFGRPDVENVAASQIADLTVADTEKAAVWASLFDFALDLADQASEEELENAAEEESLSSAAQDIFNTPLQNLLEPDERAALTAGFGDSPAMEIPPQKMPEVQRPVVKKQDVSAAYHVDLPQEAPKAIPVTPTNPPKEIVRRELPVRETNRVEPARSEPVREPVKETPPAPRVVRSEPIEKVITPVSSEVMPPSLLAVPAHMGAMGASLWSAIEPAVAALAAGHTILEARPPKQLASLLTVDMLGRIHVWMLADPADPTAYSRVWQWAHEHRQLIALTRRDVKIDGNADVQLHLVLPQGMTLVHAGQDGFERLRIHSVRFGGQQGVVLVSVEG